MAVLVRLSQSALGAIDCVGTLHPFANCCSVMLVFSRQVPGALASGDQQYGALTARRGGNGTDIGWRWWRRRCGGRGLGRREKKIRYTRKTRSSDRARSSSFPLWSAMRTLRDGLYHATSLSGSCEPTFQVFYLLDGIPTCSATVGQGVP